MTKKKVISCILIAALALALALTSVTFAWLAKRNTLTFPTDFGSANAEYFGGGNGTENAPYEISDPIHLYNLAWLQYLGYFNMRDNFNNGLAQSHFKLTQNIDMSNAKTALPPIGTAEYPFIGKFDGNSKIISNLTVSNNKEDFKQYPTKAVFSDNILHNAVSDGDISIVGLFGVVGNYNNYIKDGKYGENTVDTKIMSVSDFYADTLTVKSTTSQTLVGLIAGYVGCDVKNTGVYQCKFDIARNAVGLTGYDSTVSKYSIVGDYDKNTVSWKELDAIGGTPGTEATWGGSIDMMSLHNRFTEINGEGGGSVSVTIGNKEYKKYTKDGEYTIYYNYNDPTYQLHGGKREAEYKEFKAPDDEKGFCIKMGTEKYMTVSGGSTDGAKTLTTDEKSATTWFLDENGGLYAYIDNTKWYVNNTNFSSIALSTERITTWKKDGTAIKNTVANRYLSYDSLCTIAMTTNGTRYRAEYSNLNSGDVCIKLSSSVVYKDNFGNYASYLPLNENNKGTAYFVGGSANADGDIWIAKQNANIIRPALGDRNTYNGTLNVYTRTTSGFTLIDVNKKDQYGLTKYWGEKGTLAQMKQVLEADPNSLYALQFQSADINKKNIMYASNVQISGRKYQDYEMPADCIDINLNSQGYITMFAAVNRAEQAGFFSLHQIIRDADQKIVDLKEIKEVYKPNNGGLYLYLYTDGIYSDNVAHTKADISNNYTLEFDMEVITKSTGLVSGGVYYFEVPVNKGEYALGPTTSGTSAYLMYLDIGANGSDEGTSTTHAYSISCLDFVSPEEGKELTVPTSKDGNGNFMPAYADVVFEIKDVKATENDIYIYFKRNSWSGVADPISTKVYWWLDGTATVTPTPADGSMSDKNDNAKWQENIDSG